MRFLLPYKEDGADQVASARVLLQGFRRAVVRNKKLDVEAPTMSRLGRRTIDFWAVTKGWKVFGADVKSAFLQSEDMCR